MIDLAAVKAILTDALALVEELDGQQLDETQPQQKGRGQQDRMRFSRSLQLLDDRLRLASALTMNEYWYARGEVDPLDPGRDDEPLEITYDKPCARPGCGEPSVIRETRVAPSGATELFWCARHKDEEVPDGG